MLLTKIVEKNGFTLVEVMITVVIVGIIASIAYPSFQDQLMRGRRSDGMVAVAEIMNRQDVFKANFGSYTTIITDPGGSCVGAACGLKMTSASSNEGYYAVTAAVGPTNSIVTSVELTATAIASERQGSDKECQKLILTSTGVKSSKDYGGTDSSKCW